MNLREITAQMANLAKLELTDSETTEFASQLGNVLQYVGHLQQVDVAGVAPMTHPLELATPLREDVVRPAPVDAEGKPKVLQSAPETLYDGFKVPPIL